MKKFLKYIVVFLLPVVLFAVFEEFVLRHIPNDYRDKREYLDASSGQLKVLFLGASHTMTGINPEYITRRSYNAAYVSQSLDIDYAIYQKYEQTWDSLRYIVLPVSYCSLFEQLKSGPEHWRIKDYVLYSKLNVPHQWTDHSEVFGSKLWYNLYRISEYYLLQKNPLLCDPKGWRNRDPNDKKDLEATGKERARVHTIKDPVCFEENVTILEAIIQQTTKHNIEVILCTFPAFHTYVENMEKSQASRSFSVAQKLAEKYSHVHYVNWISSPEFTEADFYDADHLNALGAKKMSCKMDSLIWEIDRQTDRE